jgi:hypothetical protein
MLDEQNVAVYKDGTLIHTKSSLTNKKIQRLPADVVGPYLLWNNDAWLNVNCDTLIDGAHHFARIYTIDGELLEQRELSSHLTDTVVSIRVFSPDPLTPYGLVYGGSYTDNGDQGGPVLDTLTILDSITVAALPGQQAKLTNKYVNIRDFDAPYTTISTDPSLWTGSRSEPEFEQIMCYYHLTKQGQWFDSLGYNVFPDTLDVDPQAMNGQDNSMFNYGYTPPRLFFGEGGVDDAEDADVIIHELGHAVSHALAPFTNSGSERRTYDEALGDFFAERYGRRLGITQTRMFNWDGNNPFWAGRSLTYDGTKTYSNLSFNNIYAHTDFICSALLDVSNQLVDSNNIPSPTLIDQMVLEQLNLMLPNATLNDIAWDFHVVDGLMTNGSNFAALKGQFGAPREIITYFIVEEHNADNIMIYVDGDRKTCLTTDSPATVQLYALNGQLLFSSKFDEPLERQIIPHGNQLRILEVITTSGKRKQQLIYY